MDELSTYIPSKGIWYTKSPKLRQLRKKIKRDITYFRISDAKKRSTLSEEYKQMYSKVVSKFFEILTDYMCKEGYHFKLPHSLGTIGIIKKKSKIKYVSVIDSTSSSQFVWRENHHSSSYKVYLLWDRYSTKFVSPKFIQKAFRLRISGPLKIKMADHACRQGLIHLYYEHG